MSFIHYKFRSSSEEDTLTFDGQSMRLGDLRDSIMKKKKILKSPAYTLEITNAQTKEVYSDDDAMIPKNTSVIVKRVPVQREAAVSDKEAMSKEEAELTELAFDALTKTPNLANANASEESKIYAMIRQSTEDFDPSTYKKTPYPQYICHRCGKKGHHYVKNCPTIGDARFNTKISNNRNPAGIPRSNIQEKVRHENIMIETLRNIQDKNSRFSPVVGSDLVDQSKVPAELQCPICQQLFRDVVVTPCCGKSYCDECIRDYLVTNDIVCICGETTSPDNLIPNKALRISVDNFRNQKQSHMKLVPPIASNSVGNIEKPATTIETATAIQNPPDLHSDASLNGSQSPLNLGLDSPKKPERKPDITSTVVPSAETNDAAQPFGVTVNQVGGGAVVSAPIVVSNVAPTVINAGSIAPHILPGSQAINVGAHNVIYSQRAQSSIRHPGFISYQTLQPQAPTPGIVNPSLPYAPINIAPGTIVRRYVPVPVGAPRLRGVQAIPLHSAFGQQIANGAQISELLNAERASSIEAFRLHNASKKPDGNSPSPMPLTEDQFYLFQKHIKKSSSRSRGRRHSPDERTGRTFQRTRSRSRSRSTNKRKRKYRHDGSEEDRSHSRTREKGKRRGERRRRDSSQESAKSERLKRKTKSKRKIPKHVQREVEEFEFDNEMEFDEELKRLNKSSAGGSQVNEDDSDSSSSSSDSSTSRSPSPDPQKIDVDVSIEDIDQEKKEKNKETLLKHQEVEETPESAKVSEVINSKVIGDEVVRTDDDKDDKTKTELVQKLDVGGDTNITEKPDNSTEKSDDKSQEVENLQPDNNQDRKVIEKNISEEKPKRKTKIIKRKVLRIVKVRRKKTDITSASEKKINKENNNDIEATSKTDSVDSKTKGLSEISSSTEVKSEETDKKENPNKKQKLESSTAIVVSHVEKKKPSKIKSTIPNLNDKETPISPSKVEVTEAEVRAKKEAEKRALLEKAKRIQRTREANEIALKDGKNADEEEKRRKREKYLAQRKKQKEKVRGQDTSSKINESKFLSDASKKPDQVFYKPGDAKLKSISEQSKKRLKQSEVIKKVESDDEEEETESDVLKSKVTSITKIITPDKIKKRILISEDDIGRSQSGDEVQSRRVVKIDPKKRTLTSTVHTSKEQALEGRQRNRDSETAELTDRKLEKRRREKEEQKWELKEKKSRHFERESEEKKHLKLLEKEKQESYEREQKALREKERLERKLLKERQRFDEILRQKEEIEQRKQNRAHKRKIQSDESDADVKTSHRKSRKSNKDSSVIHVDDSIHSDDEEDMEEEEDDEHSERERSKKKKKKNKRKKDKKRSSRKKEQSVDSDEDQSEDSESESHSEEEVKRKKKKKRRSRKHKKRSKNKKHKKKSKKKKSRRKETSSDEEEIENESESEDEKTDGTNEEEEDTPSQTEDAATQDEEADDKDKESESAESVSSEPKKKKNKLKKIETNVKDNDEEEPMKIDKSDDEEASDENTQPNSSESVEKIPEEEVKLETSQTEEESDNKNAKPVDDSVVPSLRKERLESDDIELDYDEDISETDPDLLYGDLNFDTQQEELDVSNKNEEAKNVQVSDRQLDDVEDGEITDEDDNSSNKKLLSNKTNESDDERTLDEVYSQQVERAVDDAFNELVEKKEKIKDR